MNFEDRIETLGDDLRMKLDHIRWFLASGKAAVMVGAGFSRNAETLDCDGLSDWNALATAFYDELYPNRGNSRDLNFITPMRLASEYETSFSRKDLDALIDRVLPDGNVRPGNLHKQLLDLPWRDVFTTNYDTLLERTLPDVDRNYGVVTNKSTLLYSQSPRIVKLHGSMPDVHPYVVTEEDYRTYPEKYPELVNTVRQSLIENLFCLIGFSGDDPNFLSWIGWLKDVIGTEHSPVYLITFDKTLKATSKNLFAGRNVKVVNLAETVADKEPFESYSAALTFFFEFIRTSEESKLERWNCEVKVDWCKKEYVDAAIETMMRKRLQYPGWIVMPARYHRKFGDLENYLPYTKGLPEGLTTRQRIRLMYELDFRLSITLSPRVVGWYVKELESLKGIDKTSAGDDFPKVTSLWVSLLSIYREEEEPDEFTALEKQLLENIGSMSGETMNRFQYERCLMYLYVLDYERVRDILRGWDVMTGDCNAMLWKACITAEVKKPREAEYQLSVSKDYIRSALGCSRNKANALLETNKIVTWMSSVYAMSYKNGDGLKQQLERNRENIFREVLGMLHTELQKEQRPRIEHIVGYNIGSEATSWHSDGGAYLKDFLVPYRILKLLEVVGCPLGFPLISLNGDVLKSAFPLLYKYKPSYVVNSMVRSYSDTYLDQVMDKDAISMLSADDVRKWVEMRLTFAEMWVNTDDKALNDKIKHSLLPTMVRLCVLLDEQTILKLFRLVLQIKEGWYISNRKKLFRTICECLDSGVLEHVVVPAMMELGIPSHGEYEFPDEDLNIGQVSQKAVDVICEGLRSEDVDIQRNAYGRVAYLYHHHHDVEPFESVLRVWRNNVNPLLAEKLHSYNVLGYDKDQDKNSPKDLLTQVIEMLKVSCKPMKNRTSVPVQDVTDKLHRVNVLFSFSDVEQVEQALTSVAGFLSVNKAILMKDDSRELLGGLRTFTGQLFDVLSETVRLLEMYVHKGIVNPLSKEMAGGVCDIVEEFYTVGFCVGTLLSRLCQMAERDFSHGDDIDVRLRSSDGGKRSDACRTLVLLAGRGEDMSAKFDKLLAYAEICQDEKLMSYLNALYVLVAEGRLDDDRMGGAAKLLDNLRENLSGFSCSGNSRSGMRYHACQLAGAIAGIDERGKYEAYTSKWRDMRKDGWGLNDEQKGYTLGLQSTAPANL